MIFFRSDYSTGTHPNILKALVETNHEHTDGYGEDVFCEKASSIIKKRIGYPDADVHFMVGGTPANLTTTAAFLRPHEAVIAPKTGHVYVHETGALEATGHKVIPILTDDGKLYPEHIEHAIVEHEDEHMVLPKMIYISNSTEIGTIYTKSQLLALRKTCDKHNLIFYMDGARLGSALTSSQNDVSIEEIAQITDAFYIGGTKNGALFGEALVITKEDLKKDFRFIIKQRGGLLAKGRLLGIQFEELFKDDLYFELASHANKMADMLRSGLEHMGVKFEIDSPSNQIFPIFNNETILELEKDFFFYRWHPIDSENTSIRLVTAFMTKENEVAAFLDRVKQL